MISSDLQILILSALSIGFIHTLFGPDHYLPFIVMAKARNWSMIKTGWITFLCGIGHVGSSIILGTIGIAFGISVHKLTFFESVRGSIAAYAIITFGLIYLIWGIRKAVLNRPHKHIHFHDHNDIHEHEHTHLHDHKHVHVTENAKRNITPWVLFTIFFLGPCEPLIPLLMYPATQNSMHGVLVVSLAFSIITLITMISVVMLSYKGIQLMNFGKLERFSHVIAGATIMFSGLAIVFLGL